MFKTNLKLSILLSLIVFSISFFLCPAIAQEDPYMLFVDTDTDITIYSYVDGANVWIYDSADNLIWEGILNEGEPQVISTPAGTYLCVGDLTEPTFGASSGGLNEGLPIAASSSSVNQRMPVDSSGLDTIIGSGLEVVCVTWKGNPLLSHDTYSGKSIRLKGILRGTISGKTYEYQWSFGDGSPDTSWATVTDYYEIETTHTYTGSIGTPYTARLRVRRTDDHSDTDDDTYLVTIRDNTRSTRVNIAIDEGLWYLHKQIYRYTSGTVDCGRISGGGNDSNYIGGTGQAAEAFQNGGHIVSGDWDEDPYIENVQRLLNHILINSATQTMSSQYAGHPEDYDGNGSPDPGTNGIGLYCNWTTYENGIGMLALASSQVPTWTADSGISNPDVAGRTYAEIVQDMSDFCVWAQGDRYSDQRGGWRYSPNASNSDNSAVQWPILGMQAGEQNFGTLVPQWAKDETKNYWIPYSQNSNGGFGYTHSGYWLNPAKTGAGLAELSWVGGKDQVGDPLYTRINNAKNYLNSTWNSSASSSRDANKGHYYGMYAIMKGAILTDPPIEYFDSHNWYEEYADWLISVQQSTGYWATNYGSWYNSNLSTCWAILILEATVFKPVPVAVLTASPNPTGTGVDVTFDGSASYDINTPPKNIVKYEFNFGDGSSVYTETATSAPDGAFDGKTTHQYSANNTYNATLKVTNDDVPPQTSAPAALQIQVTPPDHPPTAVIDILSGALPSVDPGIDYEGFTDVPITFDGSNSYDINAPSDYITEYAWDVDGAPFDYPILGQTTTQTWSLTSVYDVSLRVKDLPGLFADSPKYGDAFVKVRISVNTKPVADANGPYQKEQTNAAGTPVTLDGSGSNDPDGLPLVSYNWSWSGGSANGVNPTVTFPLGTTTVTLIVNDGGMDSDPDTTTVTIVDTTPPNVDAGNSIAVEQDNQQGTQVTITGTATDICDASLDYEWSKGGTVLSNSATLTHTFNLGSHTLTFKATDDSNNSASDTMTLTVEDTTPPTVDAGPDQTVVEGTPVTLNGTATDICDASLDYEWSEGGTVLGNSPTLTHTFPLGNHKVTLKVTDDSGNSGTDTVIVQVNIGTSNTPGKVTGVGYIRINRTRYSLQVNVEFKGGTFTSESVIYKNYSPGARGTMIATSITKFEIAGNTVDIEGTGTVNGIPGHTFVLQIVDSNPDSFDITVTGPISDSVAGTVRGDFRVSTP